jgi:hypothetical protein
MEVGRKHGACCGRAVIPAFVLFLLSSLSCCVLKKTPQLSRAVARCGSVEIDLAEQLSLHLEEACSSVTCQPLPAPFPSDIISA